MPERRSAFVSRAEGGAEESQGVTPLYFGSPSGSTMGREEEAGESSPLIGGKR